MQKRIQVIFLPVLICAAVQRAATAADPRPNAFSNPVEPVMERLDPRFDALVPHHAKLETISDGFRWVEGPVWDRKREVLFFSDIPANVVMQWRDGADAGVYLNQSGYSGTEPFRGREPGSNGLTIDAVGRLILCQHGDRRLMRVEQGGRKTVLADRFEGKRLNSPNDAVFRSNGDLYFTDPPFGLAKTFDDPRKELRFSGVYRLTAAGELTLLTDELEAPNGVAFSPDETLLYVSNSLAERPVWMIYEVRSDGTLGRGRVFMDAGKWTKKLPGLPDGLKVDRLGHVFAAGPGGVYVFSPEGVHLGTILLGVATSNCAWGGDGADLYITASTAVYRVRLATKGVGF